MRRHSSRSPRLALPSLVSMPLALPDGLADAEGAFSGEDEEMPFLVAEQQVKPTPQPSLRGLRLSILLRGAGARVPGAAGERTRVMSEPPFFEGA